MVPTRMAAKAGAAIANSTADVPRWSLHTWINLIEFSQWRAMPKARYWAAGGRAEVCCMSLARKQRHKFQELNLPDMENCRPQS